jgi:hypothetical protein
MRLSLEREERGDLSLGGLGGRYGRSEGTPTQRLLRKSTKRAPRLGLLPFYCIFDPNHSLIKEVSTDLLQ